MTCVCSAFMNHINLQLDRYECYGDDGKPVEMFEETEVRKWIAKQMETMTGGKDKKVRLFNVALNNVETAT